MTKEQLERNERCKGCKYCKRVYAQNDWCFHGCYCRPYTGKWIIEIENCPRETVEETKSER